MKRLRYVFLLVGICMIACMGFASAARADGGMTIITNKSVVTETMSKEEVRNIFLGQKVKWDNNSQVNVVCLKKEDVHEEFVREFTHKTPSQFQAWWRKMLFTGKGALPKNFETEKEVIDYVSQTEGAIGYVKGQPDSQNVKIIIIEK